MSNYSVKPLPVSAEERCLQTGYEWGLKSCTLSSLLGLSALALLVIGAMGAAGLFPGSAMGWGSIALGGTIALSGLGFGHLSNRKADLTCALVASAAVVTLGALGVTGLLSTAQVSYGLLGAVGGGLLAAGALRYSYNRLESNTSKIKRFEKSERAIEERFEALLGQVVNNAQLKSLAERNRSALHTAMGQLRAQIPTLKGSELSALLKQQWDTLKIAEIAIGNALAAQK